MKEKTIVSSVTLAASLISYFYAKGMQKDAVPYVMIGGFIGAVVGEVIVGAIKDSNNNN
ncbi:MAG: hypothetical protein Q8T03_13325 [Bacteroidota bacterium]|nr:hypothetical protein [Bacteroidota bacterium]MDP3558347.1 hypothetical protein [Bacteroidota bacterium]